MSVAVAVPWNLPCYIGANGFHPLYRALFEDNQRLRFNSIDEIALARRLQKDDRLYRALVARRERCTAELPDFLRQGSVAKRFVRHLSPSGMALAAEIPGDVELHHTSPLTAGNRPFVFHCESFLPIFQPFWSQGMGRLTNVDEVRAFYERLFAAPTCLAIFSHIPSTLEQIRRFFRNPTIDAKLHNSRIGLCPSHLERLLGARRGEEGGAPVFLFTSSAHQSPRTFSLRGGFAALLFAQRYLRAGRDGQFLFRSRRPPRADLHAAGVDVDYLAAVEAQRKVLWLETFLPEHEQLRLFTLADFLLLPSVNLHSVTLMQALAAGAIPVVSDTFGPEHYVADGETGVVLHGMQQEAWRDDPETGILVDRHDLPERLDGELAEQAFNRITQLLDSPRTLAAMRARMRSAAQEKHSGRAFRDELTDSLLSLQGPARATAQRTPPSLLAREGIIRSDRWEVLFESPPQPTLVLNTGGARVYFCKGVHFLVRDGLTLGFEELSPLVLRDQHYLGAWKVDMGQTLEDFAGGVFWSFGKTGSLTARWRYFQFRFQEKVKAVLWPYKRLYRAARWIYRMAANLRRRLARVGA
jgi:glycosyltransferase involved in cell wall biosynthesis